MYKKAWQEIISAKSILLVSHLRPDGDTLGSVLALYLALKQLGKDVNIYNPTKKMPRRFEFLPNINIISDEFPVLRFDVAVVCDCGSLDRAKLQKRDFTLINIDHHETNDNFGDINIVNKNAPSATSVVYEMLVKNGVSLTKEIATCIYVGFIEDTGFFSYGNIDEKSLQMVLALVKSGVDLSDVALKLKQHLPLAQMRLRQHIYDVFYLVQKAKIGVAIISQEDLRRIGCELEDTKNIINIVRELATVEVAIMVVQKEFGGCKISLRSKKGIDVSVVAKSFGGGGHKQASGFEVDKFEPKKIVKEIIERLNRNKI